MVHCEIQPPESKGTIAITETEGLNARRLRILLRCVAMALAAVDVWISRNAMGTDGVCYLDMGDAFFHHNWHMAINAYWSPLYAWIEGFFLWVLKPSIRWEYAVVHLVNLLIFVGVLASFEFFLQAFIDFHRHRWQDAKGGRGLSDWGWWLLGYGLFTWTSLIMIGAGRQVRPDLCVAAFVYLASGLLLRMRSGATTWGAFALFGAVLGAGYLAKAVMFPLAFVFLGSALFSLSSLRRAAPRVLVSALVFVAIASPWLAVLSRAEGRLTFGDTGTLNYQHYIDGDAGWFPKPRPLLKHPVTSLVTNPPTYEFATPVEGTYPLWYDPVYWHEGLATHFDAKAESKAAVKALGKYLHLVFSPRLQLYLVAGLVALFWLDRRRSLYLKTVVSNWPVMIPGLAAVGGYALIHTELRFVGAYVAIIWLGLFSGMRLPPSQKSRQRVTGIVVAMALFSLYRPVAVDVHTHYPPYWEAAEALSANGVKPGDTIAVIGGETPEVQIARLAKVRIIAQTREGGSRPWTEARGNRFWTETQRARDQVINALERTGAGALLTSEDSPHVRLGPRWQRLGDTADYVYVLANTDLRLTTGER
jgi:hypothetical protein